LKRVAAASLIMVALLSLCAYHQLEYEKHSKYPLPEKLLVNPGRYTGETIWIEGVVREVYHTGFQLLVSSGVKSDVFKIETNLPASIGDRAELLGLLGPNNSVVAQKIIVYEKWQSIFIFIHSFFVIPIILLILLSSWRFNFRSMQFTRRK